MTKEYSRLLSIMKVLRDPTNGCEWDRAQTFETIVPHTIEEAYEVADAVERGDHAEIRDELGDLLFQVVFQSRIAEEIGQFDIEAVAKSISDKLITRHPHIFEDRTLGNESREDRWEAQKAEERAQKGATSTMDGVALALPALLRAEKLQKRAARDGFDWPDAVGAKDKVLEELEELESASSYELEEEAGDLLLAVVNYLRKLGISSEEALRAANKKFERRYRGMETMAGGAIADLSLEEQEQLWRAVKSTEKAL